MKFYPPKSLRQVLVEAAYSLPEVIVAVLLLGTMTVSLYAGFSAGFAIVKLAREEERAIKILNQKMEVVRLCRWGALVANPTVAGQEYFDPLNGVGTLFSWTNALSTSLPDGTASASYAGNLRQVTITVCWTNCYGHRTNVHTRQLQSLVGQYGAQNYLWGAGQ